MDNNEGIQKSLQHDSSLQSLPPRRASRSNPSDRASRSQESKTSRADIKIQSRQGHSKFHLDQSIHRPVQINRQLHSRPRR